MQDLKPNTAKFSDEYRLLLRQKARTLKYDMWALFQTMVALAEPEAVLEMAALVPLPESTYEEDVALENAAEWQLSDRGRIPGYDGINMVDEPCWKSRDKIECQVVAPVEAHDLRQMDLYSAEHLRQPISVRRKKPLLLAYFGKPAVSCERKRGRADDTGDDADVDCCEEEEDEQVDEENEADEDAKLYEATYENLVKFNRAFFNREPLSGTELLEMYFIHLGAGATCKTLTRTLKDRREVNRTRWRSWKRCKRNVFGLNSPMRKSKLSQCWLASEVQDEVECDEEGSEASDDEEDREREREELMAKIETAILCKQANADGGEGFWDTVEELMGSRN